MAGRSGAAAIEVALREAATSFDGRALAEFLRLTNPSVANALEAASREQTGKLEPREGELYLAFAAVPENARVTREDVSQSAGAVGHGVELQLFAGDSSLVLAGVSFYLE